MSHFDDFLVVVIGHARCASRSARVLLGLTPLLRCAHHVDDCHLRAVTTERPSYSHRETSWVGSVDLSPNRLSNRARSQSLCFAIAANGTVTNQFDPTIAHAVAPRRSMVSLITAAMDYEFAFCALGAVRPCWGRRIEPIGAGSLLSARPEQRGKGVVSPGLQDHVKDLSGGVCGNHNEFGARVLRQQLTEGRSRRLSTPIPCGVFCVFSIAMIYTRPCAALMRRWR
jgi:hypothetical protein